MSTPRIDEAYERRLEPLYQALDSKNYKSALKLADALLKKYKEDQLVRALKAYVLVRAGRKPEGLQVLEGIVAEGPDSERVLSTMAYGYKGAGQPEGLLPAHLAAAERSPKDPEILSGLFAAHVRRFDFVKQQQVAMRLSKLVPPGGPGNDRYSWWIICSLVLQARAAMAGRPGATMPADKLLALAETMAARQAGRPGGLPSYEALLLYLDVLQGQGKCRQAVEVLDGPMGSLVPLEADRLQLRAAALLRAADLPAAAACYKAAVLSSPDDWLSWRLYLDCMLPATAAPPTPGGSRFPVRVMGGLAEAWDLQQAQHAQHAEQAAGAAPAHSPAAVEAALAAAEEALGELQGAVAANPAWRQQAQRGTLRGAALAPLELSLRRRRLAGAACSAAAAAGEGQGQGALVEGVAAAFRTMAHNSSCVADLRPYLGELSGETAAWLVEQAHAAATELNGSISGGGNGNEGNGNGGSGGGAGEVAVGEQIRRLQRLVSACQLENELGLPRLESAAQAHAYAAKLLSAFQQHMHLSEVLDEKDRGYGEELVALAAGALVQAAALEQDALQAHACLVQALLVLEAAQVRRRVSAPLRVSATALYGLLGAPTLAADQFSQLDIKHILHDTMTGHWLLPLLLAGGAEEELQRWLQGIETLHSDHLRDAGDTLFIAFQHGTYSKVVEMIDFKERLEQSHTWALGRAEAAAQSLRRAAGGLPALKAAAQQAAAVGEAAAEAGGGAAGGGSDAAQGPCQPGVLRFNEDLSTRPAWFPPQSGPCSLAVAGWWGDRQQQQPLPGQQGYAHVWWGAAGAAEAATLPAAAYRDAQAAALRERQRLPQLLLAALGGSMQPQAPATGPALDGVAAQAAADGSGGSASLGQHWAALSAAALRCGAAVQAAAAAQAGEEAAPALEAAVAQVDQLQQLLQEACQLAAAGPQQQPADAAALHAPAITTALTLLGEPALWAAAVLSSGVQACKKPPALGPLAAVLRAAADVARQALTQVQQAAEALLEAPAQQQADQLAGLVMQQAGGEEQQQQLWGFEPKFQAPAVLNALVEGQRSTLCAATEAATRALALL